MVRVSRDEPVELIAVAADGVVVHVVNDDPLKHAWYGVPRRRVFARDEALLGELVARHVEGRHDLVRTLWRRARAVDLSVLPALERALLRRDHP